MPTVTGTSAHALSYWLAAWLLRGDSALGTGWFVCYAGGAALLVASAWYPRLRLSVGQSMQLLGYSMLFAVMLFAANSARDILGNSVRMGHAHEVGVPPHFLLAPGVACVGFGALMAAWLRQRRASRSGGVTR